MKIGNRKQSEVDFRPSDLAKTHIYGFGQKFCDHELPYLSNGQPVWPDSWWTCDRLALLHEVCVWAAVHISSGWIDQDTAWERMQSHLTRSKPSKSAWKARRAVRVQIWEDCCIALSVNPSTIKSLLNAKDAAITAIKRRPRDMIRKVTTLEGVTYTTHLKQLTAENRLV